MSLKFGRPYLAIPGPSVVPDRVLAAMHRPAPNIYEGDLIEQTAEVIEGLKRVAMTRAAVAIYIGNGHAAWEAANANLFSRGDKALVLATGRFGTAWADSLRRMGVDAEVMDFGLSLPADPALLAARLAADKGHAIRAVLFTQVDTATSVRNDVAALAGAVRAARHPALICVDAIASLGCEEFRMDDWGIDVMLAASQKGLMTPPGLGLLWVNDRAVAASAGAGLRTPYWDWGPRLAPGEYWQHFCGTAPTHHLFGLREALRMLLDEEGIEGAWARHARLARAVWAAFDCWAAGGDIAMNVNDRGARAHAVTAARIGSGGAGRLRDWCEAEAGLTLGIGLGMAAPADPAYGDYLRLAHMGHVNAHMVLGALTVMEAGLAALGIAHGPGGASAAARALAG